MKKYLFIFLTCIGIATAFSGCKSGCEDDCLNGGTCVDGDCDCAPGFTGDRCQDAVSVKITKVTVTAMSFTDNGGANWDDSSGPDVFPTIKDEANATVYDGSGQTDSDVTPGDLPVVFTLPTAYETSDLDKQFTVSIYDADELLDDDDVIGAVTFDLQDYIDGSDPYPLTAEKTVGANTIKINFEWDN